MDFFRENWLQIFVGAYLIGMVLYGHYRGLIRLAVSMTLLAVTLAAVHFALPYAAAFIRDKTPLYGQIMDGIGDAFGISGAEEDFGADVPDARIPDEQRRFIEEMPLPDDLKELLIENNNDGVYQLLGVDVFAEYIGNYLANVIINLISFVVLFLVIYVTLKFLAGLLNLAAKLPVLSGVNRLAGALLGGLEGLFFLWLASLAVTVFSSSPWASAVLEQVEASPWLSFLYHYNPVSYFALEIVRGIIS